MNKIQNIPEGWKIKTLKDCFDFLRTSSYSRAETSKDGYAHYIHYGDIHCKYNRYASPDDISIFVSEEQASKSENLKNGDLLLLDASEDYNGATKCVELRNISNEHVVSGLHTIALRDKGENFSPLFSAYLTSIPFIKKEFIKQISGVKVYGISKTNLSKINLLLPPLAEQKRIAEVLGCWDEGIEELEKVISLKEQQKKWLMQRLFKIKDSWNMKRFDDVFSDYCKKNYPFEELLSATQEKGVIPRTMLEGRVMSPEGSLSGYKLINKGDFVISLRSFQGGLEYSDYKGILSPAYTVLKNIIKIDRDFYRYFFKSYDFVEKYLSVAVIGIRDGRQISYHDLKSVKIPYPPFEEQSAIAAVLSEADNEISQLKQKVNLFKQQKKWLMQQLLTGKKRLAC